MDDVNKVLMCTQAKAGATTWKTILANNAMDKAMDNVNETLLKVNIHRIESLQRFGIYRLNDPQYSVLGVFHRLKTYYKFMVVRHPFDRFAQTIVCFRHR